MTNNKNNFINVVFIELWYDIWTKIISEKKTVQLKLKISGTLYHINSQNQLLRQV